MAKISANGAHEVARAKAVSPSGHNVLYVLTSDGRVLGRATGDAGSGYAVMQRKVPPTSRTQQYLNGYLLARGYELV